MKKKYTFSQRLRELLSFFNVTQTELSVKTGISKSSISHYLKGDWEGKQDTVYKIANAFGISEAWLMGIDVPLYPRSSRTAESGPEGAAELNAKVLLDEELMDVIEVYYTLSAEKQKIVRDLIRNLGK